VKIFWYLFRHASLTSAAVAFLLLIIVLSSRFVSYLADAATGRFSSELVFSLILFKLPDIAVFILPIGLFLGIILSFGQLYVDSEMAVLKSGGVSKTQILVYVQVLALLIAFFVAALSVFAAPLGNKKLQEAWNNPENFSGLATLLPGSFAKLGQDGAVIYVAELNDDKSEMQDVFLVSNAGGQAVELLRAEEAVIHTQTPSLKTITFINGQMASNVKLGESLHLSEFSFADRQVHFKESAVIDVSDELETQSSAALWASSKLEAKIEWSWRFSLPFFVPVVALIALAMSETTHRKGRYAKLLPSIMILIVFMGLVIVVKNEVSKYQLSPALLFTPHLIFLIFGLIYYYAFECRAFFKQRTLSTSSSADGRKE